MPRKLRFFAAFSITLLAVIISGPVASLAPTKAIAKPSFSEMLFKWERETEAGNFLVVKARLNSEELINAHPRYSEESRTNMLNLVKKETVFFLWLKNIGVSDIAVSCGQMVLEDDNRTQFLPAKYYDLSNQPLEREFVIPPGTERGIAIHYPKLSQPLGRVKLSLNQCRYTFVTFAVELEWDFGPMGVKLNELRQKKVRRNILKSELERLGKRQKEVEEEIKLLEQEISEQELKNLNKPR